MLDFKIQENLIFLNNRIVAIFLLEPIDIFLLSNDQLRLFENNIRKVFNILKENSLQILMRTRPSNINDFKNHFKSIKVSVEKNKNIKDSLAKDYIKFFSKFITENNIPYKEYYIIFNIHITNQSFPQKKIEAIKQLNRFIQNISNNLNELNIEITHITNEDKKLEKLFKSFLRPYI